MTLEQALQSLRDGNRIKRPHWRGGYKLASGMFDWNGDSHFQIRTMAIDAEDLNANDWEVME